MSGPLKSVVGKQARQLRSQRRARLQKARRLRWNHRLKRLKRATLAAAAIFLGSLVTAYFADGIGIEGFLLVVFIMIAAFVLLALFPRTQSLSTGTVDLPRLADRTQVWLETQRQMLPIKAHFVVDLLGSRLEDLSPLLSNVKERDPITHEIRKLLEEHLPALIHSYTSIPEALRHQKHVGATPQAQLLDGLNTVAGEIEKVGNAVARGELDALAIRGRYLQTRYRPENVDPLT